MTARRLWPRLRDAIGPTAQRAASRAPVWMACAAALATAVAGIHWGTNAVGGSDSHCYVGQARMFVEGRFSLAPPITGEVPWPDAAATFVPSGFTTAGRSPDAVPLCPAGLSLLMAAAMVLGGAGAWFWVVPALGALAVWCAFLIGRRIEDDATGAAAAVLLACSPIFLAQLFQPMSDVPAAALWAASLAAALPSPRRDDAAADAWRAALVAGLLAGAAVAVRPNLVPLVLFPLLISWRGWRSGLAFAAGLAPGIATVATLQALMYGSPLRSGYGTLTDLFGAAFVPANLQRYPSWLAQAHTPLIALALAAPLVVRATRHAWLLAALAVTTLAAYLPYVVFEDWWYTRFLLPAFPAVMALLAGAARWASRWLPRRVQAAAFAVAIAALASIWIARAVDLSVFRLEALERKYPELGRYAAAQLPANAVVFAAQPTGALRFYARLPTLAWDAIDPDWLDRAAEALRARGLEPFLAIETWEADTFRARFAAHSALGQLDWPPRAVIGRVISVYALGDRDRYLRGERIPTTRITWPMR